MPKLDEVLLPTLNQREPFTSSTVVRAAPIRATKMNVARQGLFVDFLFVDNSGQIDSVYMIAVIAGYPYPNSACGTVPVQQRTILCCAAPGTRSLGLLRRYRSSQ
jgi:hypothetical protein